VQSWQSPGKGGGGNVWPQTRRLLMPQIEIVSHPLCPHAHRLTLIATAKGWTRGKDYTVTYLPYATLQQSASRHSPSGELPVLIIDGKLRTDMTDAAAEYLDGVTGLGLIPTDPDVRLTVREREKRAAALLDTMRGMFAGQSVEAVKTALDGVFNHLEKIDADLASDGPTEETMRMDMAALEPALTLLHFYPALRDHPRWGAIPRLKGVMERSSNNPFIQNSVCPNYAFEFGEFFKMTHSAFPETFGI
jgi:glutathione S-transferase